MTSGKHHLLRKFGTLSLENKKVDILSMISGHLLACIWKMQIAKKNIIKKYCLMDFLQRHNFGLLYIILALFSTVSFVCLFVDWGR